MVMTLSVIDRYIVRYGAVNLETINLFYFENFTKMAINKAEKLYLKRYEYSNMQINAEKHEYFEYFTVISKEIFYNNLIRFV